MPWQEVSTMSLRKEFVTLATAEGANIRQLCRRFSISPTTAHKWLRRYRAEGDAGLTNRSRRPQHMPARTAAAVEEAVIALREAHPAWGGRKLGAVLAARGLATPAASTVTAILKRHGRIDPAESVKHRPWQRFEHQRPNQLWQMDFKGHFPVGEGRCHPLTVLDDHSRFALAIEACSDEQTATVQSRLTAIFRRYGLPDRILMDNGSPWGDDQDHPYTPLTAWLIRLGIDVSHGRPYHPQTQGKDERFHRTLEDELLKRRTFSDLQSCQHAFDAWRDLYNLERPHQALGLATPASRYQISPRAFPQTLPLIEYAPDDLVRKVQTKGKISFRGKVFKIGKAFKGYPVALRPTVQPELFEVYFCHQNIGRIDLRTSQ